MQPKYIPAYLLTFVNVLGFAILMPVLPFVVERYGGGEAMYGLIISAYSAFQFIGAPWLGRMSDSTGRKPVLMITQAGTLLSWFIFGAAWFVPNIPVGMIALPLIVIVVARMLDGITGGNVSVTQAYVSDISSHAEKSYIFATIGGIAGVGFIVGPGLGGFLASTQYGFLAVAAAGAAISTVTLLSIHFMLESLPPMLASRPRTNPEQQRATAQAHQRSRSPADHQAALRGARPVQRHDGRLYRDHRALRYRPVQVRRRHPRLLHVAVGVFMIFNQAVVSRWFIRRFGEVPTMRIGLVLSSIGLFSITLTENLYLYFFCYYVLNLGISLSIPTFNTLTAQHADPRDMGEVMGISSSLISLSNAVIPVFAASLYGLLGESFYHLTAVLPIAALWMAENYALQGRGRACPAAAERA